MLIYFLAGLRLGLRLPILRGSKKAIPFRSPERQLWRHGTGWVSSTTLALVYCSPSGWEISKSVPLAIPSTSRQFRRLILTHTSSGSQSLGLPRRVQYSRQGRVTTSTLPFSKGLVPCKATLFPLSSETIICPNGSNWPRAERNSSLTTTSLSSPSRSFPACAGRNIQRSAIHR